MTPEILSTRQLNRATLARQMLLERADIGILEATAHLLGMQGQTTNSPYIALWNRLSGFRHEDMTALILDRRLVRAASLRGTLHLHTQRDLIDLRALAQPVLERAWQSSHASHFGYADKGEVIAAGRKLLDEKPMTQGELGNALALGWPDSQPLALAQLIHVHETLVQIPPTRIWGSGHAPVLTRVENWLEGPREGQLNREALVLRYLAAFGPASIADMQAWCGLTRLDASFAALGDKLVTFADKTGRTLFDLPDAPRPDADITAPIRFIPDYDNVYLGYADRQRLLPQGMEGRIFRGNGYRPQLLVDGTITATWNYRRAKNTAILEIEPFRPLLKKELRAIETEGNAFLNFALPQGLGTDIRFAQSA